MALSNAYQCRIVFMNAPKLTHGLNDLRNNKTQYEKVLYFAKTELPHLDLAVDSKNIRNTDLFTESSDLEIKITKVVPVGEPKNNNPTEINTKQENVIPANEQNNNSPTEIDINEEYILEKYTSNTRTLSESQASSKIYY